MNKLILLIFLSFALLGCGEPEQITKSKLLTITKQWKEPKVAIWYYQGTDNSYHYFKYIDLGINKEYKVLKSELIIEKTYSLKTKQEEWHVMPWGPHAIK